jgi:hypothetical protein
MHPTMTRRLPIRLTLGLALAAVLPGAASAQIACGDVLPRGSTTVLTQDVGPCDGFDYALGLDGATLDLNGHTFFCADTDGDGRVPDGIVLFARGSVLRNGTVRGCDDNVFLAGKGKHRVENVTTTLAVEDGFYIQPKSNKSVITGVVSTANGDDGFETRGSRNRFESSTASDNAEDGFDIVKGGARNQIVGCTSSGNIDAGIDVDGARTQILNSTVTGSGGFGLEIGSRRNRIFGNTVTGSAAGADIAVRVCRGNRFADNVTSKPGDCGQ